MTYLFVYLSAYLSIYLFVYLSIYLSIELAIHLLSYLSISTTNLIYSSRKYSMLFYSIPFVCMLFCLLNPSINLPINELINLSLHPCIHPSTCVYAIIYMIHTHTDAKYFWLLTFLMTDRHDGFLIQIRPDNTNRAKDLQMGMDIMTDYRPNFSIGTGCLICLENPKRNKKLAIFNPSAIWLSACIYPLVGCYGKIIHLNGP